MTAPLRKPASRKPRRRNISREIGIALLIVAAASPVSHGIAAPSPTPAPLTKQEQDAFAQQDKLAPQIHQRATQEVAEFESQLNTLGSTIRQELVGKQFQTAGDDGRGCSIVAQDPSNCPQNPCSFSTLGAQDFDAWWQLRLKDFHAMQALLNTDFSAWSDERGRWRTKIERDESNPQIHAQDLKVWLKRANAFYLENYQIVAWAGNFVWEMHVAETTGLGIFGGQTLIESPNGKGGSSFKAAVPAFGGVLQQTAVQGDVQLESLYQEVAARGCDMIKAVDQRMKITQMSPELKQAEVAVDKTTSVYQQVRVKCRDAQDANRDAFHDRLLASRDQLTQARDALRAKLGQWRSFCITSHMYIGEGDAAIYEVYRDGKEASLDSLGSGYLAFSDPGGWGGPPEAPTVHPQMSNTRAGALPTGVSLQANPSYNCYSPSIAWPTGLTSVAYDDKTPVAKFPDVEPRPFEFVAKLPETPQVVKGAAPGASDIESP